MSLNQATSSMFEASKQETGSNDCRSALVGVSALTNPTLAALDKGVKDGKWFSLMDKIYAMATLQAAWQQLQGNKDSHGIDAMSLERFALQQEHNLLELQQALKDGRYQPLPIKQAFITKACADELAAGIPAVKDRIVQIALKMVIEPIFANEFVVHSYGFKPLRSRTDALRQVDKYLKAKQNWVVDVDMKSLFDTILQAALMSEVEKRISDANVLKLIYIYLKQDIMELESPGTEMPQETVISPLLADLYLHSLDKRMKQAGYTIVKHANDSVMQKPERRTENVAIGTAMGQSQEFDFAFRQIPCG